MLCLPALPASSHHELGRPRHAFLDPTSLSPLPPSLSRSPHHDRWRERPPLRDCMTSSISQLQAGLPPLLPPLQKSPGRSVTVDRPLRQRMSMSSLHFVHCQTHAGPQTCRFLMLDQSLSLSVARCETCVAMPINLEPSHLPLPLDPNHLLSSVSLPTSSNLAAFSRVTSLVQVT